jgi:hypothetical protein
MNNEIAGKFLSVLNTWHTQEKSVGKTGSEKYSLIGKDR